MSELKRERMSSVDNAWLRMDRPSNLMMICGVLVFRNSVDLRRLKRTIRDRFLRFTRLCQRPVQVDGATWWEGSPAIDMNYHLQRLLLPAPAGKRELQMAVSALVSEPLSPAHPLWQTTRLGHPGSDETSSSRGDTARPPIRGGAVKPRFSATSFTAATSLS